LSDIKLFRIGTSTVDELTGNTDAIEKSVQTLFEKNLEALLGVRFLASEFTTRMAGASIRWGSMKTAARLSPFAQAGAVMTERAVQHGDAATEILGNALRLYSDAKLLFENGRFASCASLSVLAIEELAKFMGMIGAQPLPVRSWRSHPDKHVGSASFLLRKRYQAALREVLEETGAADPDADYRRLADMEYRDDEMALFDAVLARTCSRRCARTCQPRHRRFRAGPDRHGNSVGAGWRNVTS
jgi:AbiV family abortive infection protein